MDLVTVWFVVIAFLWTGFFFLEGFDFGVGMLARLTGRDEVERRQMLAAIGPVWGMDEVWLVTGGIAIFAAFPVWYAAVFPAAYIPLLLVIMALIVRGVAIEYRSKRPDERWRHAWDNGLALASALLPLLFGVFWSGMLHGIPIDETGAFVGRSLWSFIHPYSLLGGATLLVFSLAHGATFLSLKTDGALAQRQRRLAIPLTAVTAALMVAFAIWTFAAYTDGKPGALIAGAIGVLAVVGALLVHLRRHDATAFWLNGVAIAAFVAQIFIGLFPNALPSTLDDGFTLTLQEAAAADYPLTIITITAAIALPVVIGYQAWSFRVFRRRITRGDARRSEH